MQLMASWQLMAFRVDQHGHGQWTILAGQEQAHGLERLFRRCSIANPQRTHSGHRHELFADAGMQGHGAIEIGLAGSHTQGNGRHLDDFGTVFPTIWQPSTR